MNEISLQPNQFNIKPRFVEIDMMQVVHHSKYWSWFEESRFNYLDKILNISIQELKEQLIYMPVIQCECKYLTSLVWDKEALIDTKLEVCEGAYFIFRYNIFPLDNLNKRWCEAYTKHVFVDANFKLKLQVPAYFKRKFDLAVDEYPFAFIKAEQVAK